MKNKIFFLRLIFFINIGAIAVLLLGNLSPYVNPYKWWPIALAGIVFPLFLIIAILFFFFWLPIKSNKAIFSLLAIIISTPNIIKTYSPNISSHYKKNKDKKELRVITWNTGLMNYTTLDENTAIKNNGIVLKKLKETDADIICLQEFFTSVVPGSQLNFIDSISNSMNYPYHFFSYDIEKFDGKFYSGNIIFSKLPIIDTRKIEYPKPFFGSIIKTGIAFSGDTIDIITTRLQSVQFRQNEYRDLNNIKTINDSLLTGSKNIIRKLRFGYKKRGEQISLLKNFISKSKRPLIFTGDLNDVPVSYTYAVIKGKLKDAWVKKGAGLGRTFSHISPTLRIDHIFYSSHFNVRQVKRILSEKASDHHGITADFLLKK